MKLLLLYRDENVIGTMKECVFTSNLTQHRTDLSYVIKAALLSVGIMFSVKNNSSLYDCMMSFANQQQHAEKDIQIPCPHIDCYQETQINME